MPAHPTIPRHHAPGPFPSRTPWFAALALGLCLSSCEGSGEQGLLGGGGSGGASDVETGRGFFRDATFGNDGFWTQAAQLPQGLAEGGFTTRDALGAGLQVDELALDPAETADLVAELSTDLAPANAPLLNDPLFFQELLTRNAFLGLIADDADGDGFLDGDGGDTLGFSCALCHSVADGAVFDGPGSGGSLSGSIGAPVDGPGNLDLDYGLLLSAARNSRAAYPQLPLTLAAIGGTPIARTGVAVPFAATEAEVDQVLLDLDAFPIGQVDLLPDGIGAPVMIPSVYQVRPTAPYGVAGEFDQLVDAINFNALVCLDPSVVLDAAGAEFLEALAPGIGTQISNETASIYAETGVVPPPGGFPYVDAPLGPEIGSAAYPFGRRLEEDTLQAMALYMQQLRAPAPPAGDPEAIERGEVVYGAECAGCHGTPAEPRPLDRVPLDVLQVNSAPSNLLVRGFPYSNMLNDLLSTYDDRVVLFDQIYVGAQVPSSPRKIAVPELAGVFLRSPLLHDGSVPDLEALLDAARGPAAPHAFYVPETEGQDLIEFLTRRP
jgi:mono/diheme cytochrome c family protein